MNETAKSASGDRGLPAGNVGPGVNDAMRGDSAAEIAMAVRSCLYFNPTSRRDKPGGDCLALTHDTLFAANRQAVKHLFRLTGREAGLAERTPYLPDFG